MNTAAKDHDETFISLAAPEVRGARREKAVACLQNRSLV